MGNRFKEGDLVVAAAWVWAGGQRAPAVPGVPEGEIGTVIGWEMRSSSPGARDRPRRYYTVLWSSRGLKHNIWSNEMHHYAD